MTEANCVYCHPQNETLLWQDDRCRVLLVEDSGFTGWCRVIWHQHLAELSQLGDDDRHHIMAVVAEVERVIREQMQPVKINLASLGTGLPHLHWHIIPRYADDSHFPEPVWIAPQRAGAERALPAGFAAKMRRRLQRRFAVPAAAQHRLFVIMGVSGSGKSAVARQLSQRLNIPCLDGDFLHPRANVAKMAGGEALDDTDRQPWLRALNDAAHAMLRTNPLSLLVCSALKAGYRDILRQGNPQLSFLFLDGSYDVIEQRLRQRTGHFFKPGMLDSQFAALERPRPGEDDIITMDIDRPLSRVVDACAAQILHAE